MSLLRAYLNIGIKLEAAQFNILRQNLVNARNDLKARIDNDSSILFDDRLSAELNEVLSTDLGAGFDVQNLYQNGQEQGVQLTGNAAGIPQTSSYFLWAPSPNLAAISFLESQFADIISAANSSLKTKLLRSLQTDLVQGLGVTDIRDNLVGKGLRGSRGRDGVFRSATLRAEYIARTVTNDLLNRAALDTYIEIENEFPEPELRKQWATTSDNRTSERCISLSDQVRELRENFASDDGWTGPNPPSHVNCRSRVVPLTAKYNKGFEDSWAPRANLNERKTKATPSNVRKV